MASKVSTTIRRGAVLAASLILATGSAQAAERVLKIQTSSNASHFTLAFLNDTWVPKLEAMTNGSLSIELLPIEAVVPRRETPEASRFAGRPCRGRSIRCYHGQSGRFMTCRRSTANGSRVARQTGRDRDRDRDRRPGPFARYG